MAATTVVAMPPTASPSIPTACACPSCGLTLELPPLPEAHSALLQAQRQVADLQAQVRALDQKAADAINRWADYEKELSRLRAASTNGAGNSSVSPATAASPKPNTNATAASASPRSSFLGTNRISQFLSSKSSSSSSSNNNNNTATAAESAQPTAGSRSSGQQPHLDSSSSAISPPAATTSPPRARDDPSRPAATDTPAATPPPPPPKEPRGPSTDDLLRELNREKKLRRAAEARVDDTSKEVEELSVSLFEQANEMVATERRARAKLEERVTVLEQRDVEKRVRLERLEGAMARLDRVKALLEDSGASDEGDVGGRGSLGREDSLKSAKNGAGGKQADHDVA
ncbi:hypothetical protein Micbo1qcDRAFT_222455 [Microdochium bolleyi]|uniref:GDP/GTP exchange factor Sec2 N-terminal domain-containing protein n=1 Tax=Microdochium bolleyi TaxID=196109 RepID=A0A136J6F7_9PEZI|nr:hypothetical protein Micbo1qcDRAFT_222455 [Microdochium bolleyi]